MNKKYIIRKNEMIQEIISKKDKKLVRNFFIVYLKKNNLDFNRYCISVSKKIGKANVRNLYKRRLKDILMKNNLNNSTDYVIILRNAIIDKKYSDISSEILDILKGR